MACSRWQPPGSAVVHCRYAEKASSPIVADPVDRLAAPVLPMSGVAKPLIRGTRQFQRWW